MRQEKYAGLINDTVWKYNPKSYYNADNDKNIGKGNPEAYQDQRAFFLHRRHLADNIEKARRAENDFAKAREEAEKAAAEAAERRAQNKLEYLKMKKA